MARKRIVAAALMDVVVSLSLFFLMAFLVLNLFASSSLVLQHAQQRQTALEMARSHLEWLRGQPFTSLKPGVEKLSEMTSQGILFGGDCTLTSSHNGEILVAKCKVRWSSRRQQREVCYAAYIANHP